MNPILLTVWAVLVASFMALLVYRGHLSRYEEEQLFLGDQPNPEQEFQSQILRKLRRVDPFLKMVGGAAGLATALTLGLYTWDAWQKLQ